jgi:hypothetical protein
LSPISDSKKQFNATHTKDFCEKSGPKLPAFCGDFLIFNFNLFPEIAKFKQGLPGGHRYIMGFLIFFFIAL